MIAEVIISNVMITTILLEYLNFSFDAILVM